MVKKTKINTVSKAEFARRNRVTAAAVTKACNSFLKPALVGKRIDVNHPAAVKYEQQHDPDHGSGPATGIDPLYEEVVEFCKSSGKYSAYAIKKHFSVGSTRSTKLAKMIALAGIGPEVKPEEVKVPKELSKPKKPKKPHKRGHAVKNQKARDAVPATGPEETELHIPENIQAFLDFTLLEIIEQFGSDERFSVFLKATKSVEDIKEKRLKNAQSEGTLISKELVKNAVIDVFNSAHLKLMTDGAKSIAAGAVSKHSSGASLYDVEQYVSDIIGSFIRPIKDKIQRSLANE